MLYRRKNIIGVLALVSVFSLNLAVANQAFAQQHCYDMFNECTDTCDRIPTSDWYSLVQCQKRCNRILKRCRSSFKLSPLSLVSFNDTEISHLKISIIPTSKLHP